MSRILLVEDSRANARLVRDILEQEGHEVLLATDADAGLALAREQSLDLILMDIQLPGTDGLIATRALKADPRTAAIPVVLLTALAMRGDRERGLAAGGDGYLTKPIRYQVLLDEVERHVGKVEGAE